MPKYINTKHIKRMFPFEFYDELNENTKEFIMGSPAFTINYQGVIPKEKRKALFYETIKPKIINTLNKNNIISVEPFGEVLILDICYRKQDMTNVLDPLKRSQVPISMLTVQLYDSNGRPVFSEKVSEKTISEIPEVLWDDPNLMINILTLSDENPDGPIVACLKIPKHIENKILIDRGDI